MKSASDFVRIHHALTEVTKLEDFEEWLNQSYQGEIEKYFSGYRLIVRSTLQLYQDHLHQRLSKLNIESNLEYQRARAEIADIDALQNTSEASNLVKNLEKINRDIYTTHNTETLSDALSILQEEVIKPFDSLLSRVFTTSSGLSKEESLHYLALYSLVTFVNDTRRGYPEAFQIGWLSNRFTETDLNESFEGYKVALYWIYTKLGPVEADNNILKESILGAKNWKELDAQFNQVRSELLEPFETRFDGGRQSLYKISEIESAHEIEHLLTEAPDTAVGINKALNRLFLWDFANKASDVISGSGSAGFLTILMGIQGMRKRLDTSEPIQVRRIRHPDEPGYNYSYAIELSGWSLEGTGTLHGWAVFVRIATDYSGFGSSQHKVIENYLEELSSNGAIYIREFDVQQKVLEEYLSEKGTRAEHQSHNQESMYDNRRLTQIIRNGEDTRTEFKREATSTDKIATEIAALANQEGGVLIFGVDDEGNLFGVDNVDKLDNWTSSILNDKLSPQLSSDIHRETVQGKNLVIVEIPDADRPVAVDYVYYGRKGANKRKLTYSELKEQYG